MPDSLVHLRFLPPAPGARPDVLFGFSLPLLPDLASLRGLTASTEPDRLREALERQRTLVANLWASGVTAFDLRLAGDSTRPGVGVGLLCRLRWPANIPESALAQHCYATAEHVRQRFHAAGYDLEPLASDTALMRYLAPFSIGQVAEIRRQEELFVAEDAYAEYECYVPYPWSWSIHSRARLLDTLTNRNADSMVSVYLEPTQLTPPEQAHLSHAVSPRLRALLTEAGPGGETILRTYHDFEAHLRQPFLVRIALASSSPAMLQHLVAALLDDLHATQQAPTGAVPAFPASSEQWQAAVQSLTNLVWIPWGENRGLDLPGTARLRYLMSDAEASAVFRIPVPPPVGATARPTTPNLARVLLIFASPQNGQPLDLSAEEAEIRASIDRGARNQSIHVALERGATVHALRRALGEQGPFQILHISTHGSASGLILEDESGNGRFVPLQGVAALLRLYVPPLQCVLLNACDSISQGAYLRDVVPYTIAMEGPLGDRAALEFSRGFYDALARGEAIERAFHEGRVNVQLTHPTSPFQPVLLKRI